MNNEGRRSPQPGHRTYCEDMPSSNPGGTHSVTSVPRSNTADRQHREVQYLAMMGVRMVCLLLAFLAGGWLRWVMLAGAVFLPWIAVLIANNRGQPRSVRLDPGHARGLAGAPAEPSARSTREESGRPPPEVIVVPHEHVTDMRSGPRPATHRPDLARESPDGKH